MNGAHYKAGAGSGFLPLMRLVGAVPLRTLAIFGVVSATLIATLIWLNPAPPKTLHLAIGRGGGLNGELARQYQADLQRDGIQVELVKTEGSIHSLQLLTDPEAKVDVAFVLGGVAHGAAIPGVVALGSLYYDPIWVFYRRALGAGLALDDLRGRRVSIGSTTSGNYINAIRMLEAYGLNDQNTHFELLGSKDALAKLQAGELDAAFVTAPPESNRLKSFFAEPRVRLLGGQDNAALAARLAYLQLITVPRGTVDLAQHFPPVDTQVLSTTMTLVARESVHPALLYRLLTAMRTINGQPGLLARAHEFPADRAVDFPLSTVAERFYASGVPFLQAYFPFWIAILLDRFLTIVLPVLVMMFPILRVAPAVYGWAIRARLTRWYARLLQLEVDLNNGLVESVTVAHERLDGIERGIRDLRMPLTFSSQVYVFKEHIDLVRRGVREGRWQLASAAPAQLDT